MSDEGQAYWELCAAFGKTPDEMAAVPGPARYFLRTAHREHRQQAADRIESQFDT